MFHRTDILLSFACPGQVQFRCRQNMKASIRCLLNVRLVPLHFWSRWSTAPILVFYRYDVIEQIDISAETLLNSACATLTNLVTFLENNCKTLTVKYHLKEKKSILSSFVASTAFLLDHCVRSLAGFNTHCECRIYLLTKTYFTMSVTDACILCVIFVYKADYRIRVISRTRWKASISAFNMIALSVMRFISNVGDVHLMHLPVNEKKRAKAKNRCLRDRGNLHSFLWPPPPEYVRQKRSSEILRR